MPCMHLLLSSSPWFILLCLTAGALYAFLLYKPEWGGIWSKVLAVVRALAVAFICFFLLSPVLIQNITRVQKPVVLMVMDNSQSIRANKDSVFYKEKFIEKWRKVKEQLGGEYEVEYLTAGSNTRLSDSILFNEKRTNLGQITDYINQTYAKQNVGAVVIASDGVYNKGSHPLYKQFDNHASCFTIGVGDSSVQKDAVLRELNLNSIAYLGNDFPIDINMAAYECKGSSMVLTVTVDGKTLLTKPVGIDKNDFFQNISVPARAEQAGTRHVIATLSVIQGEVSKINNRKDAFIEVIDGREKILMAYQGPHPDIGALKDAITANSNYELVSMQGAEVKVADIPSYSVVILHQLPSREKQATDIIDACRKNNIPLWCIAGTQSAVDLLQNVAPQAKVNNSQGRFNDARAVLNQRFNLFTLDNNTVAALPEFPPLRVPYGVYPGAQQMEVLAWQKIGAIPTQVPLWGFVNANGDKTAVTFGEGFWRWRIADYAANENHLATNELVSKTIQFLAAKDDRRKFRVYPVKSVCEEDEAVRFIAEMYNSSYELVNKATVNLELTDNTNRKFKYTFSPYGKSYQLDIGLMPPGIYKFKATAEGIPDKVTGQVLVTPIQAELVNTRADFGLMRQLATRNSGAFFKASEFDKLVPAIQKNTTITSMSYQEKKVDELINVRWLFFVLMFIIAIEWFVRKYEGRY